MKFFGNSRRIRTLWLGVNEGMNEFVKLLSHVNENVKIGKRSDKVHLTIARVKSGRNMDILTNFVNNLSDVKIGEMLVKNVKLKKSVLTQK